MKIISWNVNGIRAVLNKGFREFVKDEDPDVVCIQETKARKTQVNLDLDKYEKYWNSAQKKGYSGTLIMTKKKPINVFYGMSLEKHDRDDAEGRILVAEYDKFFLVNVYTPNSKRGLKRLDYRIQWDKEFLKMLKKLEKKKPVVFCGDLNVAHKEIDLKNPKGNRKNAGFSDEEREGFDRFIQNGFVDTFREFDKSPEKYTWWSYMFNARAKGIGWRIDYFCVSKKFMKNVKSSKILDDVMGSDHCPVVLEIILDNL